MEFPSESIQTRKETLKVKLSLNFAYLMESRRHELHRITLKKMQNARGSKEQCMICLELSHNQRSTNGQNTYQSCCMFTKKFSKSFESFGPLTLMIFNMILSIQLYTRRQKPYLLNCLISMILCYHPFLISMPLCRLRLLFNVLRLPGTVKKLQPKRLNDANLNGAGAILVS